MTRIMLATLLVAFPLAAQSAEGCTCRASDGTKIAEGATACLKSQKGMVLARCERSLNNPSWTFLGTPCPSAGMTPIMETMPKLKG